MPFRTTLGVSGVELGFCASFGVVAGDVLGVILEGIGVGFVTTFTSSTFKDEI